VGIHIRKELVRCLVVTAAVVTVGCETALTFEQMRHWRGMGSKEVYDASVDSIWRVVPQAAAESGLIVVGDNKEEGYILAEKIEWTVTEVFLGSDRRKATVGKAVVFVERRNEGTHVEVTLTTSSGPHSGSLLPPTSAAYRKRELFVLESIGRLIESQTRGANPD